MEDLASMYGKAKGNSDVGSIRYDRNSLVLVLNVFTAFCLFRFAHGSRHERNLSFKNEVGSVKASVSGSLNGSRRSLDDILQQYGFEALNRPRTGISYDAPVPLNLSGISVEAVRLKSGSLYNRGFKHNGFDIPIGVLADPYVERLVLVFQNLGNWSSLYYNLAGYELVGPVLGLLFYDGSNLSAVNLAELDVVATKQPMSIRFGEAGGASTPISCISFYLNGSVSLSNVSSGNVCSINYQGHFALIAESLAPSPAPMVPVTGSAPAPNISPASVVPTPKKKKKKKFSAWKIVLVSVLGAIVILFLLVLMGFGSRRYRNKAKIARMERRSDQAEALRITSFGSTRFPSAGGTRTRPARLEDERVV